MSSARTTLRTTGVAIRAMILFSLVLGVLYTLVVTSVGQLVFPVQANGSLAKDASGQVVGSALIGQPFADADGNALPQYFQPRPSAAGDGYDGGASGGSNLGPNNPDLVHAITERQAAVSARDGVPAAGIPADAVTASASGLDPDISVANALMQSDRVAAARGLDPAAVRQVVQSHVQQRDLGFLGEPRVNVLLLNLALDAL